MTNLSEIQDKINLVKRELLTKFPDCPHTISINIWDDGDYIVSAQYGDDDNEFIHKCYWYSQEPLVQYSTEPFLTKAIKIDAKGNEYYVPDELIPYLNQE